MSEQLGSCWPFVGRGGQLARVREALRARAGVMIVGEAGVGKSRLAAQALSGLGGYGVVRALGTATAATIPFGAFAHALTGPPGAGENLLRWAARHLRDRAGGGRLLVSVDDAHRLDPASAALVHHLASSGAAAVVVTVRSGARQPAPITALWKDELLDRIELRPLDRDGVEAVLAEALGGEVAAPTVRRLAEVSGGNLLYLRELVHAGRTSGRLAVRDGAWRWCGELSLTARLRELVEARIGRLEPDERETLELVAFGEPVGAALVAGLTSAEAVERLEERGLVAAVADGRREHLRLGHPLYGQVVRDGCGTLRARRRLRTLAGALEAGGARQEAGGTGKRAGPEKLVGPGKLVGRGGARTCCAPRCGGWTAARRSRRTRCWTRPAWPWPGRTRGSRPGWRGRRTRRGRACRPWRCSGRRSWCWGSRRRRWRRCGGRRARRSRRASGRGTRPVWGSTWPGRGRTRRRARCWTRRGSR